MEQNSKHTKECTMESRSLSYSCKVGKKKIKSVLILYVVNVEPVGAQQSDYLGKQYDILQVQDVQFLSSCRWAQGDTFKIICRNIVPF